MPKFKTSAVLSTSTGRLLGDIGGVYEVVSYLVGRDVYTHELVTYGRQAAAALKAALPRLPTRDDAAGVNEHNWREMLAGWETQFGTTIDLPESLRDVQADDRNCLDTAEELMPGKVIPVAIPKSTT